jgi:preprotein translocase SecF subunit
VVIFDRVRENRRLYPRQPLYQLMNRSLNETLSRTVLTSATTLMVTLSLLVLGGQVLRGFSFLLTVGVVAGTYSTIYVASPIALFLEERADRRRAAGGHHGRAAGPVAAP